MTREYPVKVNVEIDQESLKKVVEEGRLLEFVDAFSMLAREHIKVKVVDELARVATGLATSGEGLSFTLGFWEDDPYGTPPKPWPWFRFADRQLREDIRSMVHEEVAAVH